MGVFRMEPFVEKIFLEEIASQVLWARDAFNRLKHALTDGRGAEGAHDDVTDFLGHAGVVSKILLPGAGKDTGDPRRVRGRYLRGVLKVKENDPALDRSLRDLLEHIDEQIDKWAREDSDEVYIDKGVLPITVLGKTIRHFRYLNPRTGAYSVLGNEFDLVAIMESLEAILSAVRARSQTLDIRSEGRVFPSEHRAPRP